MMNRTNRLVQALIVVVAVFTGGGLLAQEEPPALREVERVASDVKFQLTFDAEHAFDSDIDADSEFEVSRLAVNATGDLTLSDSVDLSLGFGWERSFYDFSGDAGFGAGEPWDDVDILRLGARFTIKPDERWRVFAGPVLGIAAEHGADFDDGLTVGGLVGATYTFNPRLTVGGGLGAVTGIEESIQLFPILIVNWGFADEWTLRTSAGGGTRGGGGVELAWNPDPAWGMTFGGAYRSRRFRLDGSGVAPDGVGEETSLSAFARVFWRPRENLEFGFTGGYILHGEIDLEDDDGDSIADDSYEPTPFAGFNLTWRF